MAVTPPPNLPNMPEVPDKLSAYLRRFGLWAQKGFDDCLTRRTANSELLLSSTTGGTVWRITIDDAGVVVATQLTPGSGA